MQVVKSKGKSPYQHSVKTFHLDMNAGMELQSVHICFDGIEETITQSCALALVEKLAVA